MYVDAAMGYFYIETGVKDKMIGFDHVDKFILKDVHLHIPRGMAVGLLGGQGAGKTTFLKLICGLLMPEKGIVHTLQGNPIHNRRQLGQSIGVLFPGRTGLVQELSIRENFEQLKIVYQLEGDSFIADYTDLAKRFNFLEVDHLQVKSLSIGQKRRVELASALIHRPKLLILDEPIDHLDEVAKGALRALLKERQEQGMTLVVSSYNLDEIVHLCQRLILLDKGEVLYYGDVNVLMKKYAPMEKMKLHLLDKMPDLEDLPFEKYSLFQDQLTLVYNSNHMTSIEVLRSLLKQCTFSDVSIKKSELAEVILFLKGDTKA